jgi:putative addiction module CopG family antidote
VEIHLSEDQRAFARHAVERGRLKNEEEAVREALALWEERERRRMELKLMLDDARASLDRGEGRVITPESVRELAENVKRQGRARLRQDSAA